MLFESIAAPTEFIESFSQNSDPTLTIIGVIVYILTTAISAIISNHAVRKSYKHKKTYIFYHDSLEKLYLTLYFYVYNLTDFSTYNQKQIKKFYNDINQIIQKHPLYSSTTLNTLMCRLYDSMSKGKKCTSIMIKIQDCIINEYNRLKQKLNYPTSTLGDSFRYLMSPLKVIGIVIFTSYYIGNISFLTIGMFLNFGDSSNKVIPAILIFFVILLFICVIIFIAAIIALIFYGIIILIQRIAKHISNSKNNDRSLK